MAVPDFQTWFLPLMKRIADGNIHEMNALREELANELGLSEEDRNEMLPSGKMNTYRNRIGWARTYLKKANLLTSPARGTVQITDRGKEILATNSQDLRVKDLKKYPEFLDFHTVKEKDNSNEVTENENETPEELLERVHLSIRKQLELDLLDRVKLSPPKFFEGLVVDLLLKMGYGGSREDAGKTVGRSGDGGIDGVINEDRLGLDVVCIQAKRWENSVGRPIVQAFAGSLEGVRAKKGVLITTSDFTKDAMEYVRQIEKRIVLVDGKTLASLMVDNVRFPRLVVI
ncbi:MAG: restriction endonuclease [Chitinispirillaceae bacterium]|nr:restriction endonuclease [Chitinispirillaceae bacterium]